MTVGGEHFDNTWMIFDPDAQHFTRGYKSCTVFFLAILQYIRFFRNFRRLRRKSPLTERFSPKITYILQNYLYEWS